MTTSMLTATHVRSDARERFDGNQVELSGRVTKIWSRSGDIFARLAVQENQAGEEEAPEQEAQRVTIRFPNGQVNGQEISLLKGDCIHLSGFLSDAPQFESARDFLLKAGKADLLAEIPAFDDPDVRVKRVMTYVIPEVLQFPNHGDSGCNSVRLEGVVARLWEYNGHRYARIAVYDRYAITTDRPGKNGRPFRIPHYVTIQFSYGEVAGRPVNLRLKERFRVSGYVVDRPYSENFRSFLMDAKKLDLLMTAPNSDDVAELRIRRSSTYVIAQTLIQFTK